MLTGLIIGVIAGTFIPMPQQAYVRAAVSAAYLWVKGLFA